MAADVNEAAVRFGQMLTRLRTAQRLSQNQLAQRAGLNHSYISRLESGGRGDPSRTVVEQFVGALGLDPSGREADDLRMAAGFLPVDPAHLLTGETALAKLAALLENTQLPDASRATLRRILGLLVEEYGRIARRARLVDVWTVRTPFGTLNVQCESGVCAVSVARASGGRMMVAASGGRQTVDFAHLHMHSEFSLLDGLGKIPDYMARMEELGMTAAALTDHGVMYGAMDWMKAGKKSGFRTIVGMEAYVAPDGRHERKKGPIHHLTLLARNETGYRNLLELASSASLEGFYYKPRIDYDLLARKAEGITCLSGCLSSHLAAHILHDRERRSAPTDRRHDAVVRARSFLPRSDGSRHDRAAEA